MVRVRSLFTMLALMATGLVGATSASAQQPRQSADSAAAGGAEYGMATPLATPTVPGTVAQIIDGVAYAPADAPPAVQEMIWAGNQIVGKPYVFGGGHSTFDDKGYDCSGTISYALHGAALLRAPRDSRSFYTFGAAGRGAWVSIYTRSSHAYMTVAGIRLDTSAADDPGGLPGPRWRPLRHSNSGYKIRHPAAL